jgi:uncharacterized membrane protein YbaN (DUF454 family)
MTHPHPHHHGKAYRRKIWSIALGVFFFVLGVVGILIPVMPQLLFFFLSAIFFSRVSPRLRRAMRRFRQRYPKLDRAYSRWRETGRRKRQQIIRKARKLRHDIEERFDDAGAG